MKLSQLTHTTKKSTHKVSSFNFHSENVIAYLQYGHSIKCHCLMDGSIREEAKITQKMIPAKKLDNRSNNYPSKYECHLWYIIMYT